LKTRLFAIVSLAAWTACASPPRTDRRAPAPTLLPEAKAVKVVDAPDPGCKSAGTTTGGRYYVEAGDWQFPGVTDSYVKFARIEALNLAAAKGATHVVYEKPWTFEGRDGNRAEYVVARMYVCEEVEPASATASPAAASPAQGCTKDTDCKGERICEAAKCVDPRPAAREAPRPDAAARP